MTEQGPLTIALLLATPGTQWGGMEKHTADLAGMLATRGHEVHVLAYPAYSKQFPASVRFHPLPVQLGRRNPWLAYRLKQTLRNITPDITHAQGNKAARLLSRLNSDAATIRIGTVHGIKSSHRDFEALDHAIAVSRAIYDRLEHPNRILIHNGVSWGQEAAQLVSDAARCPGLVPGKTNVIAVGRLESVKNFSLLIRAWADVASANLNAHLTIFGEGSERQNLERLIQDTGTAGSISLPGYVTPMERAYKQADLTVISSDREGFPYALIESLLAGCPVISTPVSGAKDILPGSALSPDHQVESLQNLITRSLGDLAHLKASEAAAITFAREHLTLEAMATETEKLYRDALAQTAQP